MENGPSRIHAILNKHAGEILADWTTDLSESFKNDRRISESELSSQAREFLTLLEAACVATVVWKAHSGRRFGNFSTAFRVLAHSRVLPRTKPRHLSFRSRNRLFEHLRKEFGKDPQALADETWNATELLDKLGLHTVQSFQKAREGVISRQQEELLELSTPVVKLWDGILALPMIGTLDSARTQVVMESLLQRIVDTGSEIAIIDITGVPTVDTLTAQHLLKTVTAIRMMGADCIISGIRPQIAQTIVHLGIDLQGVTTKATLADALALALKRSGFVVSKKG